jgi:hypothetical protein
LTAGAIGQGLPENAALAADRQLADLQHASAVAVAVAAVAAAAVVVVVVVVVAAAADGVVSYSVAEQLPKAAVRTNSDLVADEVFVAWLLLQPSNPLGRTRRQTRILGYLIGRPREACANGHLNLYFEIRAAGSKPY